MRKDQFFEGERVSDKDTFQKQRLGKILSRRDRFLMAKVTRDVQFGFNHKRDNFSKTKQLKLF